MKLLEYKKKSQSKENQKIVLVHLPVNQEMETYSMLVQVLKKEIDRLCGIPRKIS